MEHIENFMSWALVFIGAGFAAILIMHGVA